VLVVGGAPEVHGRGLLARKGLRVTLVEKSRHPPLPHRWNPLLPMNMPSSTFAVLTRSWHRERKLGRISRPH